MVGIFRVRGNDPMLSKNHFVHDEFSLTQCLDERVAEIQGRPRR